MSVSIPDFDIETAPDGTDYWVWLGKSLATTPADVRVQLSNLAKWLVHSQLQSIVDTIAAPQGTMVNGKLSVTVASNNLTVALKTLAGDDPSAGDPVYIRIGDTIHTITAALSVTKNAGTNWCNAGGTELAAKEIDYFVYFGYNATDGVVIGFARFGWANFYSDFSTTSTNEKHCAISTITTAGATDVYHVAGRFNAVLSAGAGYTWSIPGTSIVINRPIYESRWLDWQPVYNANYTSVTTTKARYKMLDQRVEVEWRTTGTIANAPASIPHTLPFDAALSANNISVGVNLSYDGGSYFGGAYIIAGTPDLLTLVKYNFGAFSNGAGAVMNGCGSYEA